MGHACLISSALQTTSQRWWDAIRIPQTDSNGLCSSMLFRSIPIYIDLASATCSVLSGGCSGLKFRWVPDSRHDRWSTIGHVVMLQGAGLRSRRGACLSLGSCCLQGRITSPLQEKKIISSNIHYYTYNIYIYIHILYYIILYYIVSYYIILYYIILYYIIYIYIYIMRSSWGISPSNLYYMIIWYYMIQYLPWSKHGGWAIAIVYSHPSYNIYNGNPSNGTNTRCILWIMDIH